MSKSSGICGICITSYRPGSQVFDCKVDGVKRVAHSLCDSDKYDMSNRRFEEVNVQNTAEKRSSKTLDGIIKRGGERRISDEKGGR